MTDLAPWRPRSIAFRTRGDRGYGWGHVVRTAHLAGWVRARYGPGPRLVAFIEGDDPVAAYLAACGLETVRVEAGPPGSERPIVEAHGPFDLAVVDLLEIPPALQRVWIAAGTVSLFFTDLPRVPVAADLAVSPQLLPTTPPRRLAGPSRLLQGPRYLVLPLGVARGPSPSGSILPEVLVMLGGGAIHAEANLLAARALAVARRTIPLRARFLLGFDRDDALAPQIHALLPDAE
ncbi:MAG: hypothetical protein ACT4PT_04140, partial [Methanobacteriota archaeon]